jgi:uncharacterized peroxidase-related enzyme
VSWIATIPFERATGKLRKLLERVAGPGGRVDNILAVHGLRPHTLEAHMALYKNVLHHSGNRLPKAFLETIGIAVSLLNGCDYCVDHHTAGLARLLGDDPEAARIRTALQDGDLSSFPPRQAAALRYAAVLTRTPGEVSEELVEAMRAAGLDDGEILEVNQVASYFAYANRTVLGLGVSSDGDVLGLSPGNSDDPADWGHQ